MSAANLAESRAVLNKDAALAAAAETFGLASAGPKTAFDEAEAGAWQTFQDAAKT